MQTGITMTSNLEIMKHYHNYLAYLVYKPAVAAHFAFRTSLDADVAHADDDLREPNLPCGVQHGVQRGFGAGADVVEEDLVGVHDPLLVDDVGIVGVVPPVRSGIQVESGATLARRLQGRAVLHGDAVCPADAVSTCRRAIRIDTMNIL